MIRYVVSPLSDKYMYMDGVVIFLIIFHLLFFFKLSQVYLRSVLLKK
jgi:hypothetical protein